MHGTRVVRLVLALALTGSAMACAMGDILNGPPPVDVTDEQIIGTWQGRDRAGRFVFEADHTMTAVDLPAKAFGNGQTESAARVSGTGSWRITAPFGGKPEQRNIIELPFDQLTGYRGGFRTQMSASKREGVIVLAFDNYHYTKEP